MAKVKVAEASDVVLDWMVTKCEGLSEKRLLNVDMWKHIRQQGGFRYSKEWLHGGPIIEREKIQILPMFNPEGWSARVAKRSKWLDGPTSLIAAMRCYVTSKLGPEVEVPDELLET